MQAMSLENQLDVIIEKYKELPGALLSILEEAQRLHPNNYLPEETLIYIGRILKIPLSKIYSVVTFYAFFNLKPQGEHVIVVCRGTSCHTRGSKNLLNALKNCFEFDEEVIEDDSQIFLVTQDNKFTIKTVACFGQCALAPVIEVDKKIYGYMTVEKMRKLINEISSKEKV